MNLKETLVRYYYVQKIEITVLCKLFAFAENRPTVAIFASEAATTWELEERKYNIDWECEKTNWGEVWIDEEVGQTNKTNRISSGPWKENRKVWIHSSVTSST